MEFNRKQFEAFREDLKKAVKELEDKYDVEIKPGNLTYHLEDFDMKVNVHKRPKDGKSVEQYEFEQEAEWHGFKKEDYNCLVEAGNNYNKITGRLVGFNGRSKYPFLVRIDDGTVYKCPNATKVSKS